MMKIKNHQILHEISRGSLTTVYKAKHLNLDRFVLLKVLNSQWLCEADLLERFRREARISAKIDHPNIVRVYDFEVSSDLVYISLEYVEGQTLQHYLEQENPVTLEKAIAVFKDVLTALAYTHERGILHRDIKPANIMIDEREQARLTDFGLACLDDIPAVTEQGQSLGTPAYMAPEVVQGAAGSIQSDLFSVGVTFYEVLAGKSPFQKENMAATLHAVISEAIPDISKLRPEVPPNIVYLLKTLLAKAAEKRPENATEVLRILANNTAPPASHQAKATRKNKTRRPVFGLLASLLIVLVIYLWPGQKELEEKAG